MKEKVIKALVLFVIFGILGYVITKDLSIAVISGMIMFMSMFIKKSN